MNVRISGGNTSVFFTLLRAGMLGDISKYYYDLWKEVDWAVIYELSEEQSVVELVAAGIESLKCNNPQFIIPQEWALQFIGQTLQLEQRNKEMNQFVARLVSDMRKAGIYTLLVKGQGIAQCYCKPLWRACGDVDLFLSDDNYEKAKAFLIPLASSVEKEYDREKHLGMTIDGWVVELHGRLYCGLSSRIEREFDDIYVDTFNGGNVRSWNNNGVQVFQLGVEDDVFYVFTHILQHFYKEGVGLRQICDWCRLMWTYRDKMDIEKLEARLKRAGIMTEWRAFFALVSKYLGMPDIGSGLMVHDSRLDKKADRIMEFVLKAGNMGHNRDTTYMKRPYLVRKSISMVRRVSDIWRHAKIFPMDSLRFSFAIMYNGVRSAIRGE